MTPSVVTGPDGSVDSIASRARPQAPGKRHITNGRELSLVLKHRGFDLFLGGDMHAPQEDKLARSGVLEDVDVYQAIDDL